MLGADESEIEEDTGRTVIIYWTNGIEERERGRERNERERDNGHRGIWTRYVDFKLPVCR